ncbi:MAG: hypothetical protein ACRCT7_08330 [Shewanella sp.]
MTKSMLAMLIIAASFNAAAAATNDTAPGAAKPMGSLTVEHEVLEMCGFTMSDDTAEFVFGQDSVVNTLAITATSNFNTNFKIRVSNSGKGALIEKKNTVWVANVNQITTATDADGMPGTNQVSSDEFILENGVEATLGSDKITGLQMTLYPHAPHILNGALITAGNYDMISTFTMNCVGSASAR